MINEDRPSRFVVHGHREIWPIKVTIFDDDFTIGGVDMALYIGIEGGVGDHEVHADGDRGSGVGPGQSFPKRSCSIHPVGAQEWIGGRHGSSTELS